jgi:DNA-binding CsgD family transcriptional regulator
VVKDIRLSKREKEVVELVLQGKGNKQIAASLGISVRTVEFHLKNIYTKFQVSSRIELILSLGNATGHTLMEKLGSSTVEKQRENSENIGSLHSRAEWIRFVRNIVTIAGKEFIMKNLMKTPSAFLPMAMSFAALVIVVFYIAINGVARQADEGTAAHLWQILMAAQIPIIVFFAIKWLPRSPRQALLVLALQFGAALAALAPVYILKF